MEFIFNSNIFAFISGLTGLQPVGKGTKTWRATRWSQMVNEHLAENVVTNVGEVSMPLVASQSPDFQSWVF